METDRKRIEEKEKKLSETDEALGQAKSEVEFLKNEMTQVKERNSSLEQGQVTQTGRSKHHYNAVTSTTKIWTGYCGRKKFLCQSINMRTYELNVLFCFGITVELERNF